MVVQELLHLSILVGDSLYLISQFTSRLPNLIGNSSFLFLRMVLTYLTVSLESGVDSDLWYLKVSSVRYTTTTTLTPRYLTYKY